MIAITILKTVYFTQKWFQWFNHTWFVLCISRPLLCCIDVYILSHTIWNKTSSLSPDKNNIWPSNCILFTLMFTYALRYTLVHRHVRSWFREIMSDLQTYQTACQKSYVYLLHCFISASVLTHIFMETLENVCSLTNSRAITRSML